MSLLLDLAPEVEERLRKEAARRGLSAADYARQILEETVTARPDTPTAAELVARWREDGVIGAWADREDITDSSAYARELRHRAENRDA